MSVSIGESVLTKNISQSVLLTLFRSKAAGLQPLAYLYLRDAYTSTRSMAKMSDLPCQTSKL